MKWRDYQNYLVNNTLIGARRIFHINPQGRTDCFLGSPFITDDTALQLLFNQVTWGKPEHRYAEFSRDTVMNYGRLPFPKIVAPSYETLRNLMMNKAEKSLIEEDTGRL